MLKGGGRQLLCAQQLATAARQQRYWIIWLTLVTEAMKRIKCQDCGAHVEMHIGSTPDRNIGVLSSTAQYDLRGERS